MAILRLYPAVAPDAELCCVRPVRLQNIAALRDILHQAFSETCAFPPRQLSSPLEVLPRSMINIPHRQYRPSQP